MNRTGDGQWLMRMVMLRVFAQLAAGLLFASETKSRAAHSSSESVQSGGQQKNVSCAEGVKHAREIRVGMRESEVLALLGEPQGRRGDEWGYNLWPCATPPQVGEQK